VYFIDSLKKFWCILHRLFDNSVDKRRVLRLFQSLGRVTGSLLPRKPEMGTIRYDGSLLLWAYLNAPGIAVVPIIQRPFDWVLSSVGCVTVSVGCNWTEGEAAIRADTHVDTPIQRR
jgi:hypothetical protein